VFLLNALSRKRYGVTRSRRNARPQDRQHHRARKLILEALEDRCLPSSYSFTPLADDGPNSFFTLVDSPGATSNDAGTVRFRSALKSGGEGIFTRDREGHLGIIAVTSGLISAFPIYGPINDAGTASFGADLRAGGQAILTGRGGELSRIADTGPDSPFSSFLAPATVIYSDDTVAFRATLKGSGQTGIFTGRAGEAPRILYVTGGLFSALSLPNVQRNGHKMTILGTLSSTGQDGIFLGDDAGGPVTTIATTGDVYSAFSAFGGGVPINDAGTAVAFRADLAKGGQTVATWDGTEVHTVADTTGPYSSFFGNVSLNNDGQVVFSANLAAGGSGIFSVRDGVTEEIVGTGDSLLGSTIASFTVTPFGPHSLNNAGQLAFAAHLADGRTVIVRADPLPCTITLEPNATSSHLVGDPVTWTATASNCGDKPVYQFSVGAADASLHVVRDFSPSNSFAWAPMQEGSYNVQVTVKAGFDTIHTHSAVVSYVVDSRVTSSMAVISPTANPLVALYCVPPGPGGTVHVEFSIASANPSWRSTDERPSVPGASTNLFVAGMLPNTTYEMRHVFGDGTTSSPLLFTTGSLPSTLIFPTFTVVQSPGPGSDLDQDMLFHQLTSSPSNAPNPVATDLNGHIVWYYDVSQSGLTRTYPGQSLVPGGTVLVLGHDQYGPLPGTLDVVREIDLAGNPLRETSIDAVNSQLTTLGLNPIFSFTHDVQRLPNGQTVVIGSTERTIDVNGTPTDYVGMSIVVLDENFQVAWAWDAFDHLDINRGPVLGEVLHAGDTDQVAASTPRLPAVDWLHINAVSWSPADGNLVLSLRNQDWVIKIDYRNGEGDGHIIWRLGQDGDFTVNSSDPNPWFSHQHNAHFIDDTTLVIFDNGNTRHAGDPDADSRGQVWTLDEQTMTASPVLNAEMGNYSFALGSAQRLSNGNFSFTSGFQGDPPNVFGQSIEVRPDGTKAYVLEINRAEYRSFRVRTLYEGTSDQLGPGGGARGRSAGSSLGGSVPSSRRNLAGLNSDPVNGRCGSSGTPGANPDQIGGVVALAVIAPRKQLVTPTTLPETLADLPSAALVRDGVSAPLLDQAIMTSKGDGHVDVQDLIRFAGTFGRRAGDPDYLWYFDDAGDGCVDFGDSLQLLSRFGR
jgi:hypothetical protein